MKQCTIDGCPNPVLAKGFCQSHYDKNRRHGDPLFQAVKYDTVSERFWSKVTVRGSDDCWTWNEWLDRDGYGRFGIHAGYNERAHRFAYKDMVGDIADGLVVDHLCHNWDDNCTETTTCPHRKCVNPAHMLLVPAGTNVLRSSISVPSQKSAQTHCIRGHELSGDNLLIDRHGRRNCRQCRIEWKRQRRAERRAAGLDPWASLKRPDDPAA